MPSNYTPNYQLSQWSKDDRVKMEDFNADNARTDAAIKAEADARAAGDAALQAAVNAKADASALTALTQTVNAKADASALTALTQTVNGKASTAALNSAVSTLNTAIAQKADTTALNALTQTVALKGNCSIVFGGYNGNGKYGKDNPVTLDFADTMGKAPAILFVSIGIGYSFWVPRGETSSLFFRYDGSTHESANVYFKWTSTGVSWYSPTIAHAQMNANPGYARYIALFD